MSRGFNSSYVSRQGHRGKYHAASPVLEEVTFSSGPEKVPSSPALSHSAALAEGFTAVLHILRNRVIPWMSLWYPELQSCCCKKAAQEHFWVSNELLETADVLAS